MAENNQARPACDLSRIREAVCIHTSKVMDACRDKDCIEDLRVYLTRESQAALDRASGAKVRSVELLLADTRVEAIPYQAGSFTVTITYYYRVCGEATLGGMRPAEICGLAVFTKQVLLFGGDGCAKVFTGASNGCTDGATVSRCNTPRAVVEAIDPMVLAAKLRETCNCNRCDNEPGGIPGAVLACFDEELVLRGEQKRLYVTIGQFSIIRLERDTQLLIPSFDYCIPTKDCSDLSGIAQPADACDVFSQVEFPVEEFFPRHSDSCIPKDASCTGCAAGYQAT